MLILRTISEEHVLIVDERYREDDARHVVAYVEVSEEIVEVTWVRPTPLPRRYATAEAALDAARANVLAPDRASRPIPIPHFPPQGAR